MTGGRVAARCTVLAVTLIAVISSGCALLAPPGVEPDKEVLTAIPADFPARPRRAATLLVFPPEASAVYDTTLMAYVVRPPQIAYFSRTEWAARPPQMIKGLLVRALDKSGYVGAVVTPPFAGRVGYALRTEIMALEQDFTIEPPAFHLVLRVALMAAGDTAVVATREVELHEPLPERTPHGGAVAANAAIAKALKEVAEFVHAHAT